MEMSKYLANVAALVTARREAVLTALAKTIENKIAPYPPAPSYGNRKQWYERGYGPRWRRVGGGVGGRKTSQRLNTRWKVQAAGKSVRLKNTASYSGWVHDSTRQARIHKQRGWKTDTQAVEQAVPDMRRVLQKTIDDLLGDAG